MVTDRDRMIRRLAMRGDLTVKLDLQPRAIRKETVEYRTTTWYASVPSPVWKVVLHRKVRGKWTPATRFFLSIIGWDDIYTEDADLDTALSQALVRSQPRYESIDDRVMEHQWWTGLFVLMDCFKPWAVHV